MAIEWIEKKKKGKRKTPIEMVDIPPLREKGSYKNTDVGIGVYTKDNGYKFSLRMSVYILDKFPGIEYEKLLRIGIEGDTMYFTTTDEFDDGFYLNKLKAQKRYFVKFTVTPKEIADIYADWVGYYNLEFDEEHQMYCIRKRNASVKV